MISLKKPLIAVIALMTAVFASLLLASGPASAAAPGENGTGGETITVSPTNPSCGQPVTVTGSDYNHNVPVAITVNGVKEATAHTDGSGDFSVTFTLACQGNGDQTISASGGGGVDSLTISMGSNGGSGTNNGSGGLSSTGVAVVGIGAIGVVLLLGGGLLLFAGKRRRLSA